MPQSCTHALRSPATARHTLLVVAGCLLGFLGSVRDAPALTSTFLGGDAANAAVIAAIQAGTPYDMGAAEWRLDSDINRDTFAYKVVSALFMLGYQTEMAHAAGATDQHLRALHHFQARNGLPVSNVVDAATLAAMDVQLSAREAVLAPIAQSFVLYEHMQPLHPNDVSRDTVAALYALPMNALPASLRLTDFEMVQCTSGQCVGGIQDATGATLTAWFYENRFIDLATSDYRFVGAYFDRAVRYGRMPSAVVDVDTVLHEYAHYLDGTYGLPFGSFPGNPQVPHWNLIDTSGFYAIHYDLSTVTPSGCVTPRSADVRDWLSYYGNAAYGVCPEGKRLPVEDFAEAFTIYVMAGHDFRAAALQRPMIAQQYAWLKTHVFEGVEYDTRLPQGLQSGCADVPGTSGRLPGHVRCDDTFVWDFTIPHGTVDGACGPSHATDMWTAPTTGLCTAGAPTNLTGTGPWTWACTGLNGGANVTCGAAVAHRPSAPLDVTATAGQAHATVSFTVPVHQGSSPVSSYTVTSTPGGVTGSASASPVVVAGLTNGVAYSFTVTGTNAEGTGAASAPSNTVVPVGPPSAPFIGSATAGNRLATVSFTPPASNGGSTITGYVVTAAPGGLTVTGAVSPITVTGLTAGQSYTFTVAATNALGTGPASGSSNAVVPPLLLLAREDVESVSPPALPTGWQSLVQIQTNGVWRSTQATTAPPGVAAHSGTTLLYFNADTAGVNHSARLVSPAFSLAGVNGARASFWMYRDGDATAFMVNDTVEVYVGTSPSLTGATRIGTISRSRWLDPAVSAAGWYHYVLDIPPSFTGDTTYLILLGHSQGGGNDILVDDIAVATAPAAPVLAPPQAGSGSASIAWSPGDDGGAPIGAFTVSCAPSGGGSALSVVTGTSHALVTGLTNGTSYQCSVTATNDVGVSPPSTAVAVTPLSNDAALAGLSVSSGVLAPAFDPATLTYVVDVPEATASVTITPTSRDPSASILVNAVAIASGSPSNAIVPCHGACPPIAVAVTAADGTTSLTYIVSLRSTLSTDATLEQLVVAPGVVSPTFTPGELAYRVAVPWHTGTVTITPTTGDGRATAAVNGATVASGEPSQPLLVMFGDNPFEVTVTAPDATTTLTYVVTVARDAPPPPSLHGIAPAIGPAAGGTPVVITGSAFVAGATTVLVDGVPIATGSLVVRDATHVTFEMPPGPAGPATVRLATPGGTADLVFEYAPMPSVALVTPSLAAAGHAVRVKVQGSGFITGHTTVTFATQAATDVSVVSSSELWATTPALAAGPADVAVASPGGTALLAAGLTAVAPWPLHLTFAGTGRGTVSSSAPAIACTDSCATSAEHGTHIVLNAVATDDSTFAGWAGACSGQGACAVDATAALEVTATFVRRTFTRYLAEGATSPFLDTRLALLNSGDADATATLTFSRADGVQVAHQVTVPAHTRVTVMPRTIAGLATAEFSTVVESDRELVIDRTMSWDASGYGGHAETSIGAPSPTWYLAEGATHSGFDLFYLLQNPSAHDVPVRVRYLRPSGAPIEKQYTLAPASRTNIWVNAEEFPGLGAALASTDVSAVIDATDGTPIIVERALYLTGQGRLFNAGHESAGVTAPSLQWFLAEGATGPYFDLFVLIANPNDASADVRVTYLLTDGRTHTRTLTALPNSRASIWVDRESFDGGLTFPLDDVAVSTIVASTNGVPLIVERSLWWPGTFETWHEAHNSSGAVAGGTAWALAEGEVGGARAEETYILIANTSAFAGEATVTLYFEDGSLAQERVTLPANSRSNVSVRDDFGSVVDGKRFGAVVRSEGTTPALIVVERAMYWDAAGVRWAAGTNALATRLQ